jgi:AraC-like DNA-binding protein
MPSEHDFSTSSWPLSAQGLRFMTPQFLLELLREHPLSEDCHPLAFGYYPEARGHRMRRQHLSNHLLIYCWRGCGQLWVGDNQWEVAAGDVLLLPAGTAHAYRADPQIPWSIYWVHFDGRLAAHYTALLALEQPIVRLGILPSLVAQFDALLALRHAAYALTPFVHGSCLLKALLTGLADQIARNTSGHGNLNLNAVLNLMQSRLAMELDLDDLAREARLSKYHFIRRFRHLTGHTPIQHFIHLKMQHACQLLDSSPDPVKRIAAAVGYEDPYYFSRLFKRVIGVSPQQYRDSRLE